MVKRISELKKGDRGCVAFVDRRDSLGIRRLELGLVPGTPIQFLCNASRKGPCEIAVKGSRITLGLAEAEAICVTI